MDSGWLSLGVGEVGIRLPWHDFFYPQRKTGESKKGRCPGQMDPGRCKEKRDGSNESMGQIYLRGTGVTSILQFNLVFVPRRDKPFGDEELSTESTQCLCVRKVTPTTKTWTSTEPPSTHPCEVVVSCKVQMVRLRRFSKYIGTPVWRWSESIMNPHSWG